MKKLVFFKSKIENSTLLLEILLAHLGGFNIYVKNAKQYLVLEYLKTKNMLESPYMESDITNFITDYDYFY